jgi:hypothetical protein
VLLDAEAASRPSQAGTGGPTTAGVDCRGSASLAATAGSDR